MKKVIQLAAVIAFSVASTASLASMILSFDSSELSWVGQGESHTVTPGDGYIFSGGEHRFDNSLRFAVASLNSPFGPDWDPRSGERYNYWHLSLAAPFDQVLGLGYYDNTARYPFQNDDQPGLTFSGNHRANNRNSGHFEILEIVFDGIGNVTSLAVDFTQYGETNPDWWINGKLRFNSNVPISLPGTVLLLSLGMLASVGRGRKKSEQGPAARFRVG